MNTSATLGVVAAAMVAAIALPATAHADSPSFVFESPSGNIVCQMTTAADGTGAVACDVEDTTYAPPRSGPDWCTPFGHGRAVDMLGYGQTRSVGAITCDSEPAGITCTDASTGHYFRVSPESYELG